MNGTERRSPLIDVLTTVLNDLDGAVADSQRPGQDASVRREIEGATDRLRIVWRGLRAAVVDDATTVQAAADAVTEIATDRARIRGQRDRALDLADAALGAKGVYDRPRLLEELARLRRVVAGSAGTDAGAGPGQNEEGQ